MNNIVCMDNLKFIKTLENDSVDLIYSDLLYGTGRNFGDFQDLKPKQDIINNHYKPRLIQMFRVLKSTGTIYLQMDNKINHWIRLLMDEIFGYDNFKNELIWNYEGQSRKSDISNKHDIIVRYTKSNSYTYNTQYKPHTERSKKEYRHFHNNEMCARTCRRDSNGNKVYYYSPLNPLGTPITSVWNDIGLLTPSSKERVNYQTQKPKELLKRIVLASSNKGDVVADFYLGSGTTAVVCKELNRKFIGCDINEKAIEITLKRLSI